MKRILSWLCVFTFLLSGAFLMSACNQMGSGEGEVYYLNFKPEQEKDWQELAKTYTEETGVKVTVVTAASNSYENTLSAEIVKSRAPTLFQVNGPVGLESWKDYCYDLAATPVYGQLTSDDFALKDGDKVYGIAYVIETYGLIYNKTLLDKYFALPDAKVKSLDEVNNWERFKELAEDIHSKRETLGIKGAFTSAGMDNSSDWRYTTHLANLPIYYEYQGEGVSSSAAIKGTYLDQYRRIWDLYLNNATVAPTEIGAKTGDESLSEFLRGEAVFYQNGTWAWNDDMAQKLGSENVGIMPIYIGAEGEEGQGLCTGSENYWCVNKNAREADIKATLDFMNWLVTSETGTTALADKMGFVIPFKQAKTSSNPLNRLVAEDQSSGRTPVLWNFATIPGENWKKGMSAALLAYAQGGQTDALWDGVKTAFVDGWKKEYDANH